MPPGIRKNFLMKASISGDLDAFVEQMQSEGADTKQNQVVAAALILFFEQDRASQIELIKMARTYDLDKMQAEEATQPADPAALARDVDEALKRVAAKQAKGRRAGQKNTGA